MIWPPLGTCQRHRRAIPYGHIDVPPLTPGKRVRSPQPEARTPARTPLPRSALHGAPQATKLALRVHLRLATCRNYLMRECRRSVERWGLTLPQFDVLAELGRASNDGFTFIELSRLLLVTSGNLTGIVDRLEGEGLLVRQHDQRDRRLVRLVLTRKGRRLVEQMLPFHARDVQSMLAFMPAERLQALNELLGSMRDGLRARAACAADADGASYRGGRGASARRVARKPTR